MQTFLPYADFQQSARCLDRQRLGKQRVECLQILKTLVGMSDGWANHPAVKMWRGYEPALVAYTLECCGEWQRRGYKDTIALQIIVIAAVYAIPEDWQYPHWMGRWDFHESHRSNLIRKMPERYGQIWYGVRFNLPYVWPEGKQDDAEKDHKRRTKRG